jgi:RNA polymerase sigma factor (sigma-70 family)
MFAIQHPHYPFSNGRDEWHRLAPTGTETPVCAVRDQLHRWVAGRILAVAGPVEGNHEPRGGYRASVIDEHAADAALWNQMRSGDTDAWGLLFDRHAQQVYRFCSRILNSPHEAEDALSEAFLEVWRSRRSFTVYGDSALPILLAIARRACQKRLRSAQRHTRRRDLAAAAPRVVEDIAEELVGADEATRRQAWLRERVAALPPPYRDVYELVIYAEMPQEQVARLLDVPLGTVKSRMARARHALNKAASDAQGVSPDDIYERARP